MALSSGSQDGEFTSAFGRVAEVHGRTASAAFDANARSHFLPERVLNVGYSDLTTFYTNFKSRFGDTPKQVAGSPPMSRKGTI
jgi:hypothetical protein